MDSVRILTSTCSRVNTLEFECAATCSSVNTLELVL